MWFAQSGAMKRVLFVQHGDVDKPGLLAEELASCGVDLEVFHAWRDPVFPELWDFDGLALGGGGQSAWEVLEHPYLEIECGLVRSAVSSGRPVIGLCLGAQLIARALGAEVRRAAGKEIGFFPVSLRPEGLADPVVGALPAEFPAAHWHGDVFGIPSGAECLGSSQLTPNQILRHGPKCLGFQFHLEMTAPLFEELVQDSEGFFRDCGLPMDALIREAGEKLPLLEPAAREVFRRWAALL